MKIWLDDLRPAPEGWQWCQSVCDASILIRFAEDEGDVIELISLDHDMGDQAYDGGDGIKLMDWLLDRGTLYPLEFHTANPVGRENMERMYRRYWLGESI